MNKYIIFNLFHILLIILISNIIIKNNGNTLEMSFIMY